MLILQRNEKVMVPRAACQKHFDKFTDESGAPKAKCKYCGKIYVAARKGNGTMTMDNHLLNKYPKFIVLQMMVKN